MYGATEYLHFKLPEKKGINEVEIRITKHSIKGMFEMWTEEGK